MAREIITPPVRPPRGVEVLPSIGADQVKLDIEGARFWIDRDGPHAIRVSQVIGLTGNPAIRLYRAALAPGIPRYGEFHSAIAYLPVSLVEAAFADKGTTNIAIITTTYGFASVGGPTYFTNDPGDGLDTLPQLEILSTVQPSTTQFELMPDGTKKRIVVWYIDETGEMSTPVEQGGSVEYMLPMETVRYMRREQRNPQAKSRLYKGHVNSTGVFGDPPDMWLCTVLNGVSDDGGATFNVTYEFQRNSDSWNPYIVPTDPVSGAPRVETQADRDSLPEGDLARHVRVFPRANFWDLDLVLPARRGVG